MRLRYGLIVPVLTSMLLVAGCGNTFQRRSEDLSNRLEIRLAPQVMDHQAALMSFPYGARVTLPEDTLFPPGSAELTDQGRYVLASVVEGLLDPTLLQIGVTGTPATPGGLQQTRVDAVTQYIATPQVRPALSPAAPPPAAPGPEPSQGISITIAINASGPG